MSLLRGKNIRCEKLCHPRRSLTLEASWRKPGSWTESRSVLAITTQNWNCRKPGSIGDARTEGCGDFMDVPSVNERSEQNLTTSVTRILFSSDRVTWNVLEIALKLPFKRFGLNRGITLKLFHREDTRKIIQKLLANTRVWNRRINDQRSRPWFVIRAILSFCRIDCINCTLYTI